MTEVNSICVLVFPLFLWIHFALLIFLTLSPETAFLFLLFQLCDPLSFAYPDFQFPFAAALYVVYRHLLSLSLPFLSA